LLLAATGTAVAGNADLPPSARYTACIEQARIDPKNAFEDAIAWQDMGGGAPAEHCAASALITLGLFKDAAARLEDIAQRVNKSPAFKAQLLGQAAQGWLLGDLPARAEAVASAALKLTPGDVELLIDRAQARAAMADYKGALQDLNGALIGNPRRADALTFRAAAKRFLDDPDGALIDVKAALEIDLNHSDALLERGILRRLKGDDAGARADWLMVLSLAPDGPASDAARTNLEKMDVKVR